MRTVSGLVAIAVDAPYYGALAMAVAGRGGPVQGVMIPETGRVTERLRVREIDDDEGRRLVRIVGRGSGSVVTWRRRRWCCCLLRAWRQRRSRRWLLPGWTGSVM
jgi:hypothetical protein